MFKTEEKKWVLRRTLPLTTTTLYRILAQLETSVKLLLIFALNSEIA